MAENYEALVARIRYHIQKANFMGLKEHEGTLLLNEAADAIEGLLVYFKNQEDTIKELVGELEKVERKHGKWLDKTMSVPNGHGQTYTKYGCSACKSKFRQKTNFCPNCGADMRGGEDG